MHVIPYSQIREAVAKIPSGYYWMRPTDDDNALIMAAVNQGIDSRLEAGYLHARGDRYQWRNSRIEWHLSPESLPVLLRRLLETEEEHACSLASAIINSLDLDDGSDVVEVVPDREFVPSIAFIT